MTTSTALSFSLFVLGLLSPGPTSSSSASNPEPAGGGVLRTTPEPAVAPPFVPPSASGRIGPGEAEWTEPEQFSRYFVRVSTVGHAVDSPEVGVEVDNFEGGF